MFREIILPIFRSTRLCVTACGTMHPRCCRSATSWVHYTTSCNTQSNVPEDGQNNCPKRVELMGIINKPLLLRLFGCPYYLYQWCTAKQISDNEIYLLIKYIKIVLWRVTKLLSYIEDARCLKVNWSWSKFWCEVYSRMFSWRLCEKARNVSVTTAWCLRSVFASRFEIGECQLLNL